MRWVRPLLFVLESVSFEISSYLVDRGHQSVAFLGRLPIRLRVFTGFCSVFFSFFFTTAS